jgi:Fic family protein
VKVGKNAFLRSEVVKRTTGRYETTVVAEEEVRAFVPYPLPPKKPALQIDSSMTEELQAAAASIERLAIASEMVPSVDWLVYTFVRKEAVLSSQIEGTQATLVDLLSHEAMNPDRPLAGTDVDEVCNYLSALSYARSELRRKGGLPLSTRLLNQAHRRLMAGRPGRGARPGEVRSSQNWVGGTRPGNAVFVPPPPHALSDALSKFEQWMHAKDRRNPLVRCALLHAQFETIHPYLDGNGRIGRLLITLLLEHWELLSEPLLYLSLYFKRNRDEYYRRLGDIRTEGDWEAWVAFFLEGVRSTADETMATVRQMFALVNRDRANALARPQTTVTAVRLFEELPQHPMVTVATAVKLLDSTKPTVSKAIAALVNVGILVETTGRRRDRLFSYQAYLDLLREGTEIETG